MKASQRQLLIDLLTLPTSPFNEQFIIDYIARWVERRPALRLTQDRFGNLQIRLQRPGSNSDVPLVLAAHMDHPGFEAEGMLRAKMLRAIWRGGVAPEYFPGVSVRFHVDAGHSAGPNPASRGTGSTRRSKPEWIRGKIKRVKVGEQAGRRRVQYVDVSVERDVPPGSIGMWDLPDPVIRGSRLHARGCDDLAGVAAVLAALDELTGREEPVNVIAMLNRAEEVGFAGAMAACREGVIPREAQMVSVECSSELAGGRMGEGPILRVGDLATVFTPELTAFCRRVAEDLVRRRPRFRFQRKLMDGGTCEASAFLGYGYQTSGLCIALGNYHNMDRRRRRIAAEFVDLGDWQGLVDWFVALAVADGGSAPGSPELMAMLERLYEQWTPLLESTAARVRLGS